MNFEEHAAKPLLAAAGIATPEGVKADTSDRAYEAAGTIGPCVVKAQIPAGKRGKAGGIRVCETPDEARAAAEAILGLEIGGAIGVPLYIAQALSVALYTLGFAESINLVAPDVPVRPVALATTLLVAIVALVSAQAAI